MFKYLIIYTIVRLSSYPTVCERVKIYDETYDKKQAIEFYEYMKTQTSVVRLDSVPSVKPCNKSDIFQNFESKEKYTYLGKY